MISLKELAGKKKDGEVADEKVIASSKVCLFRCISIFTIVRGLIFIPHANTILADHGKARFYPRE